MTTTGFRPSVCIDAVFMDSTFDEACAAVKAAGINAIEFWGWWNKDLDALNAARQAQSLSIAACCTKFVSLVDATQRDAYLSGLEESIAVAKVLGAQVLISQVGDALPDVSRDRQRESLVSGLKQAASLVETAGVTLAIEPLNELVDHPGYFLVRSQEAFEIVDQVGSDNVKVLFDIYHQQISEGHLIHTITENIDKIGHFHAAGNPGRHELQLGEINYPAIFQSIKASAFDGFVGLEYWPRDGNPVSALREVAGWLPNGDAEPT